MQHTSIDVFAYVNWRRRVPASRELSRFGAAASFGQVHAFFAAHTAQFFVARGVWRGLESCVGRAKTSEARAESEERRTRKWTEKGDVE